MKHVTEIEALKTNIAQMQSQLYNAYKRINELNKINKELDGEIRKRRAQDEQENIQKCHT